MNKKYLLVAVGAAGAIGAGVYFREELKEFYLSEISTRVSALKNEKIAVVETIPETASKAAVQPEVYHFFSDLNRNPSRKSPLSLVVDATQIDVYSQINPQIKPEITEQTNTPIESKEPSCTLEQPCSPAAKGLLNFCKSVRDKYNQLEWKAKAGYNLLNQNTFQPAIGGFSDQVDELAELYLDEEHKNRRNYDKTLSNLSKLTSAQLGTLEQELQKRKEVPLTEEEKRQQPYQKCASSLSKFSLEELEKLTGDIAKQWEADDYDHLLRQKELPFWLDSLQRVYGVVFTKDSPAPKADESAKTTEEK